MLNFFMNINAIKHHLITNCCLLVLVLLLISLYLNSWVKIQTFQFEIVAFKTLMSSTKLRGSIKYYFESFLFCFFKFHKKIIIIKDFNISKKTIFIMYTSLYKFLYFYNNNFV